MLQIKLLGEFSLLYDGAEVARLKADRPQTLLAYLLLHRQVPQARQQVAFLLWPDSSESQARANLRNLLFTLRHALPEAGRFLAYDTHTVQWLVGDDYTLDVAQFEETLSAAASAGEEAERLRHLEAAVSLYRGELLPGNYDDWIIPQREQLNQRFLSALRQLVSLLERSGDFHSAIAYCRRLVQQDPLDEVTYVLLMRLHGQMGDRAGVRRVYQQCAAILMQELNVEPAAATRAVYESYIGEVEKTASHGQPVERPALVKERPVRATPGQASRLPPQAIPFVGRETELTQLAELLADPLCRMITIAGPGGAGKTRLALEVAKAHVTIFSQGVAFVAMAQLADPNLIATTIADELQLPSLGHTSRRQQLLDYLEERQLLLVLDNMEQLREGSGFLSDLLALSPQLKVLVTSRRRLGLPEEWIYDLHGLALPDPNLPESIHRNGGVMLFAQVARRANSRLALATGDYDAIARICHLLGGMPLALELAASWVRSFTCQEIAAEIERNLDFLVSTHGYVPERHRSMRAIFDQSWALLRPEAQAVFGQLALFRGGFDRTIAEKVAGASLPNLSELLENSLVRRLDNGRFDLHEMMRQYAAERLGMDETALRQAEARYLAAYLDLAEAAAPQLIGEGQLAWLDRLESEQDNLRQALSLCLARRDGPSGVRLVSALGRFWWLRGNPHEGMRWFRQILAQPDQASPGLGDAYIMAALLARTVQEYREAQHWLEKGAAILRQSDDLHGLGQLLNELGMLAVDQGEFGRAQELFAECLHLAESSGHQRGIAVSLLNLGMVAHHLKQYPLAERQYAESLALARTLALPANVAMALNSYGLLLIETGQVTQAVQKLKEGLQLNQELGYCDGLSWSLVGLVAAAAAMDRWETAAQLLGALDSLRKTTRAPLPPANQVRLDDLVARLEQKLGADPFSQARQLGHALHLHGTVQLAMQL